MLLKTTLSTNKIFTKQYKVMKKLVITLTVIIAILPLLHAGSFAGGSGTKEDPFLVATANQLNEVRNHSDAYFRQIADISLNVAPFNMGNYWIPIGGNRNDNSISNNFTGQYDGDNYVISNLTVVQPGNANVGLFGHIGGGEIGVTTIKNIHLRNVIIIGGRATGALAGRVTGNQNTRIENCSVETGYVRGDGATGGLVGSNNSFMVTTVAAEGYRPVIFRCYADVSVLLRSEYSAGMDKFGGLVGCNQKGMISHSYALGDVTANHEDATYIGGFAGCSQDRGIIINSYSAVGVYAENSRFVSGFAGELGVGRNRGEVINTYWNTDINPLVENSLGATGLTNEQMQNLGNFKSWDFNTIWQVNENINSGFPTLRDSYSEKTEKRWTAQESNSWENPNNWSAGIVPSQADKVIIPDGVASPVIASSITIFDLTIEDQTSIEILENASLTITGELLAQDESTGNASVTGGGYLELAGNQKQTIPAMTISNLVINNPNDARLTGELHIQESLKMTTGLLDLSGSDLILAESAKLIEWEEGNTSSRIYGCSGVIRTFRHLNRPSGSIAGMGLEISSNSDLGLTRIERGHSELNGTDESKSIMRWFNIVPANNTNLDATIVFHYFVSELNVYGENDNFSLFKKKNNETDWIWIPSELDALNQVLTAQNVDEFSIWTAGSTDNPLPIVLLSFDATPVKSGVELKWVTAAEINNDYFTIERSNDGIHFEPIAMVDGAGTTSQSKSYQLKDHNPVKGISYYRLKQTDFNGSFEYSRSVSVYKQDYLTTSINVYPNPSNGNFTIQYGGERSMYYQVVDMQGRVVYSDHATPGITNRVSLTHLPKGVYTVVFQGEEIHTEKIQVY